MARAAYLKVYPSDQTPWLGRISTASFDSSRIGLIRNCYISQHSPQSSHHFSEKLWRVLGPRQLLWVWGRDRLMIPDSHEASYYWQYGKRLWVSTSRLLQGVAAVYGNYERQPRTEELCLHEGSYGSWRKLNYSVTSTRGGDPVRSTAPWFSPLNLKTTEPA